MIEDLLGQGAYATVYLVRCSKNDKHYAAKILKSEVNAFNLCFKHEKRIVIELNKLEKAIRRGEATIPGITDIENFKIVDLKDYFIISQEVPVPVTHLVFIFEKLDLSLFNLLESNDFQGLSLSMIQRFARNALEGLQLLKVRRITHGDIKPENILLVDKEKYLLRLIDFGLARKDSAYESSYIQSRYYRAPEVFLGLQVSEAIDMWSLGCTLAELYLGIPIFAGNCSFNMLALMTNVLGPMPQGMIQNSPYVNNFFLNTDSGEFRLMNQNEFETVNHVILQPQQHYNNLDSLQRLEDHYDSSNFRRYSTNFDLTLKAPFVDFLSKMLDYDPDRRITPRQALQHAFLTRIDQEDD